MQTDWILEIGQKALTVAIVAAGAALAGGAPLEYKALAMVAAYAVWTKVIAPRIEDWFKGSVSYTRTEATRTKSGFELF
jgi:hypothetical protein